MEQSFRKEKRQSAHRRDQMAATVQATFAPSPALTCAVTLMRVTRDTGTFFLTGNLADGNEFCRLCLTHVPRGMLHAHHGVKDRYRYGAGHDMHMINDPGIRRSLKVSHY